MHGPFHQFSFCIVNKETQELSPPSVAFARTEDDAEIIAYIMVVLLRMAYGED